MAKIDAHFKPNEDELDLLALKRIVGTSVEFTDENLEQVSS